MDITKAIRDIDELKEPAKGALKLFMDECEKRDIRIFITETYRSKERQNYLYEQGRSRPGVVVTWTKSSRHTSRMAWDIAAKAPQNLYDAAVLKRAGEVAKMLGITWGGTWQTPDMPHFEVTDDYKIPIRFLEDEEKENEMIYNYIDENMPSWARPTIEKLVDKGYIKGDEEGKLGLNDTMLKLLVINDRAGLYN